MSRDFRPVYTAVSEHEAKERFVEFTGIWGEKYPAIITLWENTWAEFVPFLNSSPEIRKVIYSTNAVESLHARMRRAARGSKPLPHRTSSTQMPLHGGAYSRPPGRGRRRSTMRWKAALNAFAITFEGRILPTDN